MELTTERRRGPRGILPSPEVRRRWLVGSAGILVLVLAGALIPFVPARLLLAGTLAAILLVAVALRPALGAYALIALTPLVAGIDRGRLVPVLRPAEMLAAVVAAGLIARGMIGLRTGSIPRLRPTRVDASILLLAVASSILPLAWMLVRNQTPSQDDVLYALMIWKYYGVFLIVRFSVKTEQEVRRCLWVSMAAASIVATIAVMQALQLFGVTRLLAGLYTPYGSVQALQNARGGSTLSLPIAVADLMILNLAIAVGMLLRGSPGRSLLLGAGALFIAGDFASGEFSGLIALVLAVIALAALTRRTRVVAAVLPALIVMGALLWPVIERRLLGFQSASGLPVSWQGRIYNLTNYFWPPLFSHYNFVLGVRVSARVSTSTMATGYIWIESGYTWLLWAGGLPLLAAFLYFLWVNLARTIPHARDEGDVGVASLAVATGLIVIAVLMVIDPHLTYRGSADLLFALLALASVVVVRGRPSGSGPATSDVTASGESSP